MPFLNEQEWQLISPHLNDAISAIKSYREKHQCSLHTARLNCKPKATELFEELTGMPNVHFETIYHHRLKDWGPECSSCGELLRTSKANYCANCGVKRENQT